MKVISYIKKAGLIFVVMSVITGVIYPLGVTVFAQVFVKDKANGSIVTNEYGESIGSTLVGQSFIEPKHFWSRPSAAGDGYDGYASAGTNKSPTGEEYQLMLDERIKLLKKYDPQNNKKIPVDLITSSGSGLDPHISVAAAKYQVYRVEKYSKIDSDTLLKLIEKHTDEPFMGILGESKVNVLNLNIDLDKLINNK